MGWGRGDALGGRGGGSRGCCPTFYCQLAQIVITVTSCIVILNIVALVRGLILGLGHDKVFAIQTTLW